MSLFLLQNKEEPQENRNDDTGSGPYLAPVTANAQGRVWEQSKHQESLPLTPSPQSLTTSGSLPPQGCPEKTKQRLFHQPMWYFGCLHISVISEGHSPVCHILAGEVLGLALVCSQHKSHPDCKRHPQKGMKSFAITQSCRAITNTKTQLKLSSQEYKILTENILQAVKSCHLPLLTTVLQASTPTSHSTEQALSQYERQILLGTLRATLNYQGSQTSAESRTGTRKNANWSPQNSVRSPIYS